MLSMPMTEWFQKFLSWSKEHGEKRYVIRHQLALRLCFLNITLKQ